MTEHAFGEFYRQHARSVWAYVYRTTANAADADDIVQEAFIRLYNVELPGRTDEEMRKYLFRIAGNLVADRWRRSRREQARRQRVQEERERRPVPSGNPDVARTFAALKPRERALLWLAYVEGHDHQQIAQSLRLAHGSVKVLLSRARARLRDLLQARGVDKRPT